MRQTLRSILLLIAAALSAAASAEDKIPGLGKTQTPKKKLIEFGWDMPSPEVIQKHINEMQQRPFDGVMFRLRKCTHAFDTKRWQTADIQPDIDALAATKWGKLTDNFPILSAVNKYGMDWFDDAQWDVILSNLKLFMGAAKAGNCPGIAFDPEHYHVKLWELKEMGGDRHVEVVFEQVRRRGKQFMNVLQAEQPKLKLLTLFNLTSFVPVLRNPNQDTLRDYILKHPYCLHYPFYLGMLEAAGPGVTIIEGNEGSYFFETSQRFYWIYHLVHQRVLRIIPDDLKSKYNAQIQLGNAIYVDHLLGMNPKGMPAFLSPEDRNRFLEHTLYHALDTSDEYVWCYSEKMDWWGSNEDKRYLQGRPPTGTPAIPPGLEELIAATYSKVEKGKDLGFDITEAVKAANVKMKK